MELAMAHFLGQRSSPPSSFVVITLAFFFFESGVVPVTSDNVAQASAFAQKLVASGSTNMMAGLQLAMKDPKVEGTYIHLLT